MTYNPLVGKAAILNHPYKPIVILGKDRKILELNEIACTLFFYKKDVNYHGIYWEDFCQKNNMQAKEELILTPFERQKTCYKFETIKKPDNISCQEITIDWDVFHCGENYILIGNYISPMEPYSKCDAIKYSNATKVFTPFSELIVTLSNNFQREKVLPHILRQIVDSLHEHANLKGANFEYITLSPKSRSMLGIRSLSDVVGQTVDVLKDLPKEYIDQIHEIDEEAAISKVPKIGISGKPFINAYGKVEQLILNKIPLLDIDGRMLFLMTLSINSSTLKDPGSVRTLYKTLYKSKKESRNKFLSHYGLDLYKHPETGKEITERELDVVMYLSVHNNAKLVARDLELDENTIRKHIETIKLKMCCVNKVAIVETFLSHVKNTNLMNIT